MNLENWDIILLKTVQGVISKEKCTIPLHYISLDLGIIVQPPTKYIQSQIEKVLEEKKICLVVFLNVTKSLDKVWHNGLEYRLNLFLPKEYNQYIVNSNSELKSVRAGVLWDYYFTYCRHTISVKVATFWWHLKMEVKLQEAVNKFNIWTRKYRFKLNQTKSTHMDFTKRPIEKFLPIILHGNAIPYAITEKYLGVNLDARLK